MDPMYSNAICGAVTFLLIILEKILLQFTKACQEIIH